MEQSILKEYVDNGLSIAEISEKVNKSKTSVRHWLKKYNLKTIGKAGAKSLHKTHDGMKVCSKCNEHKSIKEFRPRKDRPGTVQPHCKACDTKNTIAQEKSRKQFLIKYLGNACVDCGVIDNDIEIYDFHHLEPEHKDFTIQSRKSASLDTIVKELDKCVLLCANCHTRRHSAMKSESGYSNKIEGNTERFRAVREQKLMYACDNAPKCSQCGYDEHLGSLQISYQDEDKRFAKFNRQFENWTDEFKIALKNANILCRNCWRKNR